MAQTGVVSWSQTAATNATADNAVNWSEGQAPSTVNDSARAMMASTAKWRDDISGAIVTGGTSTAYTVSSNQVFDNLGNLHNQVIAFSPHITSGDNPTLNVDGLGARGIYAAPALSILAGTLIQGTPYLVTYNNADGRFYLHNFIGDRYNIPIGGGIQFWGATSPNSSLAFPVGQAISRTTYSYLFNSVIGTTYGAGDGSTTFNLPDLRGRVAVPADNMGGSQAFRINNILGNPLGSVGGEQQHTLTVGELPTNIASAGSASVTVTSTTGAVLQSNSTATVVSVAAGGNAVQVFPSNTSQQSSNITSTGSGAASVISNNTGGQTHNNVQPSIVCNYIMRII